MSKPSSATSTNNSNEKDKTSSSSSWSERLKGIVEDFKATGSITESSGKLYLDAKEVGTLIRAIGIYPTESQVKKLLDEMQVDQVSNAVDYENFLRVLSRIISDEAFKRDSEEKIYRCFLALDKEKKGYLTKEELSHFMTMEGVGEPLSSEEMEEMIAASTDPKEGKIFYEEYIYNLVMEHF